MPEARTVLIVEDDPEMLDYIERVVRGAGFRTRTASDGLAAMQAMRNFKPDLAILDLMLPKYGGLEMLFELRIGATRDIPVIVVTARYNDAASRAVIDKLPNVAAFFEKPVSGEDLVEAVRGALP
jgi:DNA-binding response OmpR family regulator